MKRSLVVSLDRLCWAAFLLLGISSSGGVDSFPLGKRQSTMVNGCGPIPTRFKNSLPDLNKRQHLKSVSQLIVSRQSRENEATTKIITQEPLTIAEGNNVDDSSNANERLLTTTAILESTRDDSHKSSIPGIGLIVLCSVPLVWGTYVPIVRLLYEIDPPIPGFLFSAFYFFISSITTIFLSNILDNSNNGVTDTKESVEHTPSREKEELLAGLELGSWYVFKPYLTNGVCLFAFKEKLIYSFHFRKAFHGQHPSASWIENRVV